MTDQKHSGHCQCGKVAYTVSGDALMSAICHCSMCRKAHAAPSVAWVMFQESQVEFTGAAPKHYKSSSDAARGFCAECGTQISFTADYIPGLIDISICSLDNPEAFTPEFHCWHSKHLSWVEYADELPRHPEFPPMGE